MLELEIIQADYEIETASLCKEAKAFYKHGWKKIKQKLNLFNVEQEVFHTGLSVVLETDTILAEEKTTNFKSGLS